MDSKRACKTYPIERARGERFYGSPSGVRWNDKRIHKFKANDMNLNLNGSAQRRDEGKS